MCLKRRAILVACDPNNKLHSITDDLGNWYCSLQEPYLGGWDCFEMTILSYDEATITKLREEIKNADDNEDYLLFIFSGHGRMQWKQSAEQTIIQLMDGVIEENELYNLDSRCQRKTIFFDCCRNNVELPHVIRRLAARITIKDVAQFMYLWLLSISAPGIVRMYSSQKGEVAQDSPSFTKRFFESTQKMIHYIKREKYICYSTYDVFRETAKMFLTQNIQHPEYSTIYGGHQFPFIINPFIQIEDLLKRIHF